MRAIICFKKHAMPNSGHHSFGPLSVQLMTSQTLFKLSGFSVKFARKVPKSREIRNEPRHKGCYTISDHSLARKPSSTSLEGNEDCGINNLSSHILGF